MNQLEFQDIQQESSTVEDLCLYLKYHLRLSSCCLMMFSICNLVLLLSQKIPDQDIIYISLITYLFNIILGLVGLIFSFKKLHELLVSTDNYYIESDDKARYIYLLSNVAIAINLTIALLNPILLNLSSQQNQYNSMNSLITSVLNLVCLICLSFMAYIYLMFCRNATAFYSYISIFAILVSLLSICIYVQERNISGLYKVGYIPEEENNFPLQYLKKIGLSLGLIMILSSLQDFIGTYYSVFKNPEYKYILGMLLVCCSYTLIGCGGKLIRNLVSYDTLYKQDCRTYMNYIPESLLKGQGGQQKYKQVDYLECPFEQRTQKWEMQHKIEYGCLDQKCCNMLMNILLGDYIFYIFEVILLAVSTTMLAFVLVYVRKMEESALLQTLRNITTLLQISFFLIGLVWINFNADIDLYRSFYVRPQNYIELDHLNELVKSSQLINFNNLSYLCQSTVSSDFIQNIQQFEGQVDVIITVNYGQFYYSSSQQDVIVDMQTQNDQNQIYLKGDRLIIQEILNTDLQICVFQQNSSVDYFVNSIQQIEHLEQESQGSLENILDEYLKFVDISIIYDKRAKIYLYNTLLTDCYKDVTEYFLQIKSNTFYNYPAGQYGTVLIDYQNGIQSCFNFQSIQDIQINGFIPIITKLTTTLSWQGQLDLDIVSIYKECIVGAKYRQQCAELNHLGDSIYGNIQTSQLLTSNGEQIVLDFISKGTYMLNNINLQQVYQLLQQSNAQISVYNQNQQLVQISIKQSQIQLNQSLSEQNVMKLVWVGFKLVDSKIIIINKIDILDNYF
ncbi:hypothetical protein pb186bvf_006535 [Paramecium bursaria]